MSFRNRCTVAGSNGLVNLSVPLENGRDHKGLMRDIRISYAGRWQTEHLRTIESCYARSPYYEYYRDPLRELISREHAFLLDKNMAILEWLMGVFKYKGMVSLTGRYEKVPGEGVLDMRGRILPKNYRDWPAPVYTQVFSDRIGFQPNLCILDALFCAGPSLNKL